MRRALVGALLAACTVAQLGACTSDDTTGPRITTAKPASASVGATVEVIGERFCGDTSDCLNVAAKIDLDLESPVRVLVLAFADSSATIQIPPVTPGLTEIVITVGDRSSNALPFEVLP